MLFIRDAYTAIQSQADLMDPPFRALIAASLVLISTAFTARGVRSGGPAPILLFNGTGTSPNDVAAVETILNSNHLNYSTVNSSQLNRMGESQIRGHRLLIVPGGNFIDIGNSLTSAQPRTFATRYRMV